MNKLSHWLQVASQTNIVVWCMGLMGMSSHSLLSTQMVDSIHQDLPALPCNTGRGNLSGPRFDLPFACAPGSKCQWAVHNIKVIHDNKRLMRLPDRRTLEFTYLESIYIYIQYTYIRMIPYSFDIV